MSSLFNSEEGFVNTEYVVQSVKGSYRLTLAVHNHGRRAALRSLPRTDRTRVRESTQGGRIEALQCMPPMFCAENFQNKSVLGEGGG